MADASTTTGKLLARAAENAGQPSSGHLEVWTRSADAAQERLKTFNPSDVPGILKNSTEDLGKAVAGRDWDSSKKEGVLKGVAQQAKSFGKQGLDLIHLGKGKSPEGVMGHFGAAFGMLTTAEQIVSMAASVVPFPALP